MQPPEGCPLLLPQYSLAEAFMAVALLSPNGTQPSSPVTIPLHDEQLSNPTTTSLRVVSMQHKGFSSISALLGLQEREVSLPHLSSLLSRQHL